MESEHMFFVPLAPVKHSRTKLSFFKTRHFQLSTLSVLINPDHIVPDDVPEYVVNETVALYDVDGKIVGGMFRCQQQWSNYSRSRTFLVLVSGCREQDTYDRDGNRFPSLNEDSIRMCCGERGEVHLYLNRYRASDETTIQSHSIP